MKDIGDNMQTLNYEDIIDLFLNNEVEDRKDISIILDSEVAKNLAMCLKIDLDKDIWNDIKEIEELASKNDILLFGTVAHADGSVDEYILTDIIDEDGYTYEDYAENFYIQEELLDCLDIDSLNGEKYIFKLEDLNFKDIEELDNESEYILEERTEELIDKLLENKDCVHCLIKEALEDIYYKGYNDAIDKIQEKIYEL